MPLNYDVDLKQIVLMNGPFGPQEIDIITRQIGTSHPNFRIFRDSVQELETETSSPAGMVRLGVCQYLLGKYDKSLESLGHGDGSALARFYQAKNYFALNQYDEAEEKYKAAIIAGYDKDICNLGIVEVRRYKNDLTGALQLLDSLTGPVEHTAEYMYQRGATAAKFGAQCEEIVAWYERAVKANGSHPGALFGLALENDRHGNDDVALQLYKRAASQFPAHVGSLINLGLMYEDMEEYEQAAKCYERVLDAYPNNARARLYLKDTQTTDEMYFDEDARRKRDKISQVMNMPVSDFELSIRARTCLKKMGIVTLGDLCKYSEQDLLGSKNFGETSLVEIREILKNKGLSLGQSTTESPVADDAPVAVAAAPVATMPMAAIFEDESLTPDEQLAMSKPLTFLDLSVRARKCMNRLGITTVGELIRRTGDELMDCKNFGVTSLNEVREKLAEHNMKLRGE